MQMSEITSAILGQFWAILGITYGRAVYME